MYVGTEDEAQSKFMWHGMPNESLRFLPKILSMEHTVHMEDKEHKLVEMQCEHTVMLIKSTHT